LHVGPFSGLDTIPRASIARSVAVY
jgi:hypothetical protein